MRLKPIYEGWTCKYSYETYQAISIVFNITFGEATEYDLDDMTDEDYDKILEVRKKIQRGEIQYHSTESLGYI